MLTVELPLTIVADDTRRPRQGDVQRGLGLLSGELGDDLVCPGRSAVTVVPEATSRPWDR